MVFFIILSLVLIISPFVALGDVGTTSNDNCECRAPTGVVCVNGTTYDNICHAKCKLLLTIKGLPNRTGPLHHHRQQRSKGGMVHYILAFGGKIKLAVSKGPCPIPSSSSHAPINKNVAQPHTSTRQKQLPIQTIASPERAKSYAKPIVISIVTGHFLGDYKYNSSNPLKITDNSYPCHLEGVALTCVIGNFGSKTADALWYHIPTSDAKPRLRNHAHQLRIGFSMESSAYYPSMDNKAYMSKFDILATYSLDADVITHYYDRFYVDDHGNFLRPPLVSTSKKKNEVAFMNRNCHAISNRTEIVSELMKLYPVNAVGCLSNVTARLDKKEFFSQHKFCIAMENSIVQDYVTEKLWAALATGCLPIYMGAPNIVEDFLPDPKAAIVYDPSTMTPGSLADTLRRIAANDTLYDEHMAWRSKPLSELALGFQRLVAMASDWEYHSSCMQCKRVAEKRYELSSQSGIQTSHTP